MNETELDVRIAAAAQAIVHAARRRVSEEGLAAVVAANESLTDENARPEDRLRAAFDIGHVMETTLESVWLLGLRVGLQIGLEESLARELLDYTNSRITGDLENLISMLVGRVPIEDLLPTPEGPMQ